MTEHQRTAVFTRRTSRRLNPRTTGIEDAVASRSYDYGDDDSDAGRPVGDDSVQQDYNESGKTGKSHASNVVDARVLLGIRRQQQANVAQASACARRSAKASKKRSCVPIGRGDALHLPQQTEEICAGTGDKLAARQGVQRATSGDERSESSGAVGAVGRDYDGAGTTEDEYDAERLLDLIASRLVWSRVHEMERLKASLCELSSALVQVEKLRQSLEAALDKDLASAVGIAATRMSGRVEVKYRQSFSQFFADLIRHLQDGEQ